jgi:hypothetical protein
VDVGTEVVEDDVEVVGADVLVVEPEAPDDDFEQPASTSDMATTTSAAAVPALRRDSARPSSRQPSAWVARAVHRRRITAPA